jgi:ribonuclease P protein component
VRVHRTAFTLQAARRRDGLPGTGDAPRIGFTVTKKVGNAVVRNRIKRRLRALSDLLHDEFRTSTDYVIVARRDALQADFQAMGVELAAAVRAADDKLDRPAVRKRA